MIQLINGVSNCLMALCAAFVRGKHGLARGIVSGVSFFTLACYLDSVFLLIMESAGEGGAERFVQGVGAFVSKSILTALLILLSVIRNEAEEGVGIFCIEANAAEDRLFAHAAEGNETEAGRTECGWQYLDGLSLGVALFFLLLLFGGRRILAVPVAGEAFFTAILLSFFMAVMAAYYGSVFLYRRKQAADRALSEAAARKQEADIYLEGIETHYQQTRELWHDLKNHITLLKLLLQEEKYGQMADYLRVFGEDVEALALPVSSGNLVVDALLSDKAAKAKKAGIIMELELCDLTKLTLKADELCGLMGNLLDNALEANSQVEEERRFLRVTCSMGEECCYIRVRNASAGRGGQQDDVLHSAKSDRKNKVGHGLGLRSVQRIVHRCGGELAVEDGGTQFTAVIRLPVN